MNACVEAIRYALPAAVLSNEQLAEDYPDWPAEKIFDKTGIRCRRVAAPDEFASDLGVRAAQQLFSDTGVDPSEVDYLLYCTQTADYRMPTTACLVQHRLGLRLFCGALDIGLGCSGFVYGLGLAKALIETGQARTILLVTADTYSKIIHPADKSVRTIFGDGAAATLVRARNDAEPMGPFVYGTDGSGGEKIIVPAGGMRRPFDPDAELVPDDSGNARTVNNIFMNGPEVFDFTLRMVPLAVEQALTKAGIAKEQVDLFVFHQANRFMLEHLRRKLQIPSEKFVIAMEHVGNTVSSSIPIALRLTSEQNQIPAGATILLVAFGVGYSWAAAFIRWPS